MVPDCAEAEWLELVKNRKPVASIVVDAQAGEEELKAAERLVSLVKAKTGAALPIVKEQAEGAAVYIGRAGNAQIPNGLDNDGFVFRKIGDGQLQIAGASPRGTAYGVAEFLERYVGVRWLLPGELGVDVPSSDDLKVPLEELREEPAFLSRDLGPLTFAEPSARQWAMDNRLYNRVDSTHGMRKLFPVTEFGESHPEFYPMVDGKRLIPPPGPRFRGDRSHYLWQPNFTAPGIVDAAVARIDSFFHENPEQSSFSLGLNDGNAAFDQSPESLKRRPGRKNSMRYEDVSDDYFLWANEVAAKVTKLHPDRWMGTLAYREITDPPSAEIGVHERLVPYMTQDRLRWIDPKQKELDQSRTKAWAQQAKSLGWYDYQYGASYTVPRIYPHVMKEALKWAHDNGVRFYVAELYPNWGEGPKPWVLAKLLWNPEQDVDALLAEWYERMGGKAAAPKLAEYFALWESFWTQNILESKWWHDRGPYLSYYDKRYLAAVPQEWIAKCDALLEEAVQLSDDGVRRERVKFLRDMWRQWYRPNLVLYQAEHLPLPQITTEEEALRELKRAGDVVREAAEFRKSLEEWGRERPKELMAFYSEPQVPNVATLAWSVKERLAAFSFDGSTLLWRMRPWITKSPKVAEAMEVLAKDENAVLRKNAKVILASASGKGEALISNASFEDGLEPWDVELDIRPFPSDYPFNDTRDAASEAVTISNERAQSGKSSLRVSAWREAGKTDVVCEVVISQEIPYYAGSYYAEVFCYADKGVPATSGRLSFEALDANGKVLKQEFPAGAVAAGAGEWRENVQSLLLPELPGASKLRMKLRLNMLTPLGDFDARQRVYIDDFSIYRIQN